jgi:hypothetical protein
MKPQLVRSLPLLLPSSPQLPPLNITASCGWLMIILSMILYKWITRYRYKVKKEGIFNGNI